MDEALHLDAGPEEWLRRIARSRSLAIVPDHIAVALIALGFAQRLGDGSLVATAAGRDHLHARGIAFAAKAPKRR